LSRNSTPFAVIPDSTNSCAAWIFPAVCAPMNLAPVVRAQIHS